MPTLATPLELLIEAQSVVRAEPTAPAATPSGEQTRYAVILVHRDGTRVAELDQAQPIDVLWELNGAGRASFVIAVGDPKLSSLVLPPGSPLTPTTEVQIWRNDHLLWWGVPVRTDVDAGKVTVQCAGLLWYFSKRFIGEPLLSHIRNASFEDGYAPGQPDGQLAIDLNFTDAAPYGLQGWSVIAEHLPSHHPRPTVSASAAHPYFGRYSAKMVSAGADNTGALFSGQLHWGVIRGTISIVAWYWLEPKPGLTEADIIDPVDAFGDRSGLEISTMREATLAEAPLWVVETGRAHAQITNTAPIGEWTKLHVEIALPRSTLFVQWRLHCPGNAIIYWDAVQLVAGEEMRFTNRDQARIAKSLVGYGQGRRSLTAVSVPTPKTDLGIATAGADTGIRRDRIYKAVEHQRIIGGAGAVDEFTNIYQGLDFDIEITPTTRIFRTYYPLKGASRPDLALVLGRNVAAYRMFTDADEAANVIYSMAGTAGPDREEGYAEDVDTVDELALEHVFSAPTGATIQAVQGLAEKELQRVKQPIVLPELVGVQDIPGTPLIGFLEVGDRVPVYIDDGWTQLRGVYRVVELLLDVSNDAFSSVVLNTTLEELPVAPPIALGYVVGPLTLTAESLSVGRELVNNNPLTAPLELTATPLPVTHETEGERFLGVLTLEADPLVVAQHSRSPLGLDLEAEALPVTRVVPFDPAIFGSVLGWYDASDTGTITDAGSGAVSAWADKSGNGLHLAQATAGDRPVTGTHTLDGKNVLHFADTSDHLDRSITDEAQPITLALVFQFDAAVDANRQIFGGTTSDPVLGTSTSGPGRFRVAADISVSTNVDTDDAPHVFVAVFDGTSTIWQIDATTGTASPGTNDLDHISVGSGPILATGVPGIIAEAIVFNDALTSGEVADLVAALEAKWGL